MSFSGQPAHRNLSQSWFQLFFEGCAIKVIQLAMLQASERSGRILGNTVEVYHIVYIYFSNSLVQDLHTHRTIDLDKITFFNDEQPQWFP